MEHSLGRFPRKILGTVCSWTFLTFLEEAVLRDIREPPSSWGERDDSTQLAVRPRAAGNSLKCFASLRLMDRSGLYRSTGGGVELTWNGEPGLYTQSVRGYVELQDASRIAGTSVSRFLRASFKCLRSSSVRSVRAALASLEV